MGLRGDVTAYDNKLSYEAAIFWLTRNDYITSVIGQYAASTTANHQRYENIGSMESKGFELSVGSDAKKPIWVDLAYTYLDAKFKDFDSFYLGLGINMCQLRSNKFAIASPEKQFLGQVNIRLIRR